MRPSGIPNLGNTCYIASAFQLLYAMDELVVLVGQMDPSEAIRERAPDMLRMISRRIVDSDSIMNDIIDSGINVQERLNKEQAYIIGLDKKSILLEDIANTGYVNVTGTGIGEFDALLTSYDVLGELFAIVDAGEEMGHHNLEPVYRRACAPGQVYGSQQDAMETIHTLLDPLIEFYPSIKDLVSVVMVYDGQFIDDTGPTRYKIANIIRDVDSINQGVDLPKTYSGREVLSFITRLGAQASGAGHYIAFVNRDNQWYLIDDDRVREVTETEAMNALPTAYVVLYG